MGSKDSSIYVMFMDVQFTTAATLYLDLTKKKLRQWKNSILSTD